MELKVFGKVLNDRIAEGILDGRADVVMPLLEYAEGEGISGNLPRAYVLTRLAEDENALTLALRRAGKAGEGLYRFVMEDLEEILKRLSEASARLPDGILSYTPAAEKTGGFLEYRESLTDISKAESAGELFEKLKEHILSFGGGSMAKYIAFRWEGCLCGVENPSLMDFDRLYGIEEQKKRLMENTKAFLEGKPANNVLLYGSSGTGKSSSVKALVSEFYPKGLRICELPMHHIRDLTKVISTLGKMPLWYIVFMDDLSFESGTESYKELKRLIEGQIDERPKNVLIYATSNRRHLVRQKWEDREGDTAGEVHQSETMQEIHSLAERFGMQVFFPSYSQKEYLSVVESILKSEGIPMTEDIKLAAIRWEMLSSHRSGRAARQFVNWLLATRENPGAAR